MASGVTGEPPSRIPSRRDRSYVVMRTRVPRPFGRGDVRSGYGHVSFLERFTPARNAAARWTRSGSASPRLPRGPGSSFCGRRGCEPGEYVPIRGMIRMNASAVCADPMTRSSVWHPTQSARNRFWSSVPGMLASHSAFVRCGAMLSAFTSVRSALVVLPATRSAAGRPVATYPAARIVME